MEKADIRLKVEQFIKEQFVFDQDQAVDPDESLLESGTVDSTGMLEVVSFLEEAFGIKVKDDEMVPDNLDSISRITEFIARKA